jgi:hypothetical protein
MFSEVAAPKCHVHFAVGTVAEMLGRLAVGAQLLFAGSLRIRVAAGNMLAGASATIVSAHSTLPVSVVPVEYLTSACHRR